MGQFCRRCSRVRTSSILTTIMTDVSKEQVQELFDIANKLRIHSIKATEASNSGHPTSSSSMAEIMSVLFFHTMRYKVSAPKDASSDRFILSKGHAAPILYAAWAEAGLFSPDDLLNLRKIDNDLEGHPTPRLNFVDVATGSLSFAGIKKLDNLVAIFDINRLGQSEPTAFQHDMDTYRKRLESYGFNALVVDGHDVEALCKAFHEAASTKGKPTAIIAKTFKGRGFPTIEDGENWHGKPLGAKAEEVLAAIQAQIKNSGPNSIVPQKPLNSDAPAVDISNITIDAPSYNMGDKIATRVAYGTVLAKMARKNPRVIALDGDTKNSTFSNTMLKEDPARYIECFIAEQNLVGVGIGAACRDRTVAFVSTFAAFFTRAFDQLRKGAISQTNINCVGSHCGVSIGEDGPSQMALEDLGMFRSIPTATVFYPSDAVSTERACVLAANTKGICFIRTSRPATEVIYANDKEFAIGKANVVRQSDGDKVLATGAAVTLQQSLLAADSLKGEGINIRVMDPFTIKPIDKDAIIKHAKECGGRIIVVEDHYPEGGIGEAVMNAVAMERNIVVKHLAVRDVPRSGKCAELLAMFGIDAAAITKAVKEVVAV